LTGKWEKDDHDSVDNRRAGRRFTASRSGATTATVPKSEEIMRESRWFCFFVLGLGALLLAMSVKSAPEVAAAKGLAVHEWGVFRVHHDLDMANADMKAIWADLPKFVYGQVPGRALPKHWPNIEIRDKPVIFFHTPQALALRVTVAFPDGMPGVWWPGTQRPAVRQGALLPGSLPEAPNRPFLEWNLLLKDPPPRGAVTKPEPVPEGHWFTTLRNVPATDVYALVGEEGFGCEREKFLYYDGLFPSGKWIKIAVEKDRVVVASQVKHPVFDVTVIDRSGDRIRIGRLPRLDAGGEPWAIELAEVDRKRWPADGETTLTDQLRSQGLTEAEARSLVTIWKDELFLTEGVTVFYRLPQEEYDRLLPLTLQPRAEKIVRVGLVQHAHCEPDLADRVARLVKDLDSDDFDTREKAQQRLERMGRAGFVELTRALKRKPSPEVQRRIEEILGRYTVEKTPKEGGR
jgi:hypothetical protein